VLCYCECILLWVPCPKNDLLRHIDLSRFARWCLQDSLNSFTFVVPCLTNIFATLVHILNVDGAVLLILQVDDMDIRVVRSC